MFNNRKNAGEELAKKLKFFKNKENTIVLGLPRGGVVVAYEVARELNLPMDIIVTRKVGAQDSAEFAIGAVDETGYGYFNEESITLYSITRDFIEAESKIQQQEAIRRLDVYRKDLPPLDLKGKTAIIVDDGIATGATAKAAIISAQKKGAKEIFVAVPIISKDMIEFIKKGISDLIYINSSAMFFAVGQFYQSFDEVTDDEVVDLIQKAQRLQIESKN